MRIEQSFSVSRPPEVVFDYLTNPANLAAWQTSKTSVEQLTAGAPQLGTRVRERTKGPRGKEFEQIVEFTEFERPARVHAHIVEGPYPVDGTWSFAADGAGTRVDFVAEGELPGVPRLLQPLAKRLIARQMAGYHNNLRRNLEAAHGPGAEQRLMNFNHGGFGVARPHPKSRLNIALSLQFGRFECRARRALETSRVTLAHPQPVPELAPARADSGQNATRCARW